MSLQERQKTGNHSDQERSDIVALADLSRIAPAPRIFVITDSSADDVP